MKSHESSKYSIEGMFTIKIYQTYFVWNGADFHFKGKAEADKKRKDQINSEIWLRTEESKGHILDAKKGYRAHTSVKKDIKDMFE